MPDPIFIHPDVVVPAAAQTVRAVRAAGPGGQNVNKVASKVELRVDLALIGGLDEAARRRLHAACAASLDAEGRLIVTSQLTRDQRRNLTDAQDKVRAYIVRALVRPRARRPTRPTRSSVERRMSDKRHNAQRKSSRRDDE